jgi:internalin A
MYECVGVRAAVGPRGRFLPGGQAMMHVTTFLLSLAVCLAGCGQTQADREEAAVNAILKLGGEVTKDEKLPGRPVVHVQLSGAGVTDSDLKNLKELKDLWWLRLGSTQITDAGLKELKEFKGLQYLDLFCTQITDVGLKDLKELKGLQTLILILTQITDAGLKDLKQALPTTDIIGP